MGRQDGQIHYNINLSKPYISLLKKQYQYQILRRCNYQFLIPICTCIVESYHSLITGITINLKMDHPGMSIVTTSKSTPSTVWFPRCDSIQSWVLDSQLITLSQRDSQHNRAPMYRLSWSSEGDSRNLLCRGCLFRASSLPNWWFPATTNPILRRANLSLDNSQDLSVVQNSFAQDRSWCQGSR